MYFTYLHLINFGSFADSEMTFPDHKVVTILGLDMDSNSSNGVGKSTIKEALLFGVYGRSKVKQQDLVRRGAKEMSVEVIFKQQADTIRVLRSRKGVATHLQVHINEVKQEGTLEQLQLKLDKILGLDMDTFITYSVVDRVRDTDLSKISSNDLRLILQDLLGLNRIQAAIEAMNKKKLELEAYVGRASALIRHFPSKKRLEILRGNERSYREGINSRNQFIQNIIQKATAATQTINHCREENNELEEQIKSLWTVNECPMCGNKPTQDTTLKVLNQITERKDLIVNKIAESIKEQTMHQAALTDAQRLRERDQASLTKINRYIITLEECLRTTASLDDCRAERESCVKGIALLNEYLASSLQTIAAQIEDNMNSQLSSFSDLFCKINLVKTTATGMSLPTCTLSVFRGDHEYTYSMLSSGEQALVSLIFKLVISNLKGQTSTLFVDEGLDALDELNRTRVMSLLETSNYAQIFIISHREDTARLQKSQRILLRKSKGISSVVQV